MEVAIDTVHEGVELVSARLASLGIEELFIQDGAEFENYLEQLAPSWELVDEDLRRQMDGLCLVKFYLPMNAVDTIRIVRASLKTLPDDCPEVALGTLAVSVDTLCEEDWADSWKKYYKPVPIGERLLVQPAWLPVESQESRVVFFNNPGMSFGTGEHETTRLCLEKIEQLIVGGERVLDIGCGSGILSICASLLGAGFAEAVDIDPLAVDMARQNADCNGLSAPRYSVRCCNLLESDQAREFQGTYDLIVANIVADIIMLIGPFVAAHLATNGVFVASGIIGPRRDEVVQSLVQTGLKVREDAILRDWHCLIVSL